MKRLLVSARTLPAGLPAAVAVVFAAALLGGAPAAHAANTLYVDVATGADSTSCGASTSPCRTIQQAVDNASDGDTIQVAAGVYPESTTIRKNLTLAGAQAGNLGSAARAASSAGESVIDNHVDVVAANNVTLDGFSFDYPGTQLFVSNSSGTAIKNDVFAGYQPDNYTAYQITSAIGVNAAPGTTITRNYFTSPGSTDGAVQFFNGGCSDTVVSDNTFYAAANDGLGTIFFYCDNQPSADITVSGNDDVHVGDTNGESSLVAEAVAGDIHVTGNTVTADDASSVFYFTLCPTLGAVDISGNSVVGSASSAVTIRPTGGGTGTSYTITGNRLSGGKYGVYVYAGPLASGATVALHGNILSGNSHYGVYNGDPAFGGSINATENWWGCNAGPTAAGCSAVSGFTAFDPWLVLGISASPSTLAAGASSTITADVTQDSAGNDASASGTIPDGTTIASTTDFGVLSAPTAGTVGGKASATLTSPAPGMANVSATLDSQTVSTTVTFTPRLPTSADQCKKGGWLTFDSFKNQGDCVSYVVTRGKNPGSGGH